MDEGRGERGTLSWSRQGREGAGGGVVVGDGWGYLVLLLAGEGEVQGEGKGSPVLGPYWSTPSPSPIGEQNENITFPPGGKNLHFGKAC